MMRGFSVRQMVAADADMIERQASQRTQMGIEGGMTAETAQAFIDQGEAWTASFAGRIIACLGIVETFPGKNGTVWAVLARDIGAAHLPLTRFAKARVAESPLVRVDAIARLDVTAECAWAKLCGLAPAHVLRKFGAMSEDHVLFERIRETG